MKHLVIFFLILVLITAFFNLFGIDVDLSTLLALLTIILFFAGKFVYYRFTKKGKKEARIANINIARRNRLEREAKIKSTKERMLYYMYNRHIGGIVGIFEEFNQYLTEFPELKEWIVFRAWYKHQIDQMISKPNIYTITFTDTGEEYRTELDSRYDPNAPDWEQIEKPYYYDDDYDDYDDDDDDYNDYNDDDFSDNNKDSASDWFFRGVGIGLVNSVLGGSSSSGSSSN